MVFSWLKDEVWIGMKNPRFARLVRYSSSAVAGYIFPSRLLSHHVMSSGSIQYRIYSKNVVSFVVATQFHSAVLDSQRSFFSSIVSPLLRMINTYTLFYWYLSKFQWKLMISFIYMKNSSEQIISLIHLCIFWAITVFKRFET